LISCHLIADLSLMNTAILPGAMSKENVNVMQRWVAAYNRRDFEGLIELTDPDFEFRSRFVAIESVFRAYDGFPYAYFKTLDEAYDHFTVVPIEFFDAGAAVLMVARAEWRGKASGARGETPMLPACWMRAGKVFRAETFTDRAEAFDAVGLSERDATPTRPS
jgi:ketosteroid isomerase-like protein